MNDGQHGDRSGGLGVTDLEDGDELRQWAQIFDITADELMAAVDAVGTRHVDVKRYVRDRKE
jgi:hypothetical protein